MKLGILIPKTSCVRLWKTPADTYFYIYTLKSFIDTNTDNILLKYKENSELPKPILQFTFYLGIDHNDAVLDTA